VIAGEIPGPPAANGGGLRPPRRRCPGRRLRNHLGVPTRHRRHRPRGVARRRAAQGGTASRRPTLFDALSSAPAPSVAASLLSSEHAHHRDASAHALWKRQSAVTDGTRLAYACTRTHACERARVRACARTCV